MIPNRDDIPTILSPEPQLNLSFSSPISGLSLFYSNSNFNIFSLIHSKIKGRESQRTKLDFLKFSFLPIPRVDRSLGDTKNARHYYHVPRRPAHVSTVGIAGLPHQLSSTHRPALRKHHIHRRSRRLPDLVPAHVEQPGRSEDGAFLVS